MVVDNLFDVAVLEGELLKVFAVSDIEPRIGGDETEGPFRIEERKPVKIEVDVEVAFCIQFVRDSGGGIIRFVFFASVAEEAGKGLIHGAGEFCFVRFLVCGRAFFTRERWIGDVLLSDVRWVTDDDIEPTLFSADFAREDFDEGDVPNKGQRLSHPQARHAPR